MDPNILVIETETTCLNCAKKDSCGYRGQQDSYLVATQDSGCFLFEPTATAFRDKFRPGLLEATG